MDPRFAVNQDESGSRRGKIETLGLLEGGGSGETGRHTHINKRDIFSLLLENGPRETEVEVDDRGPKSSEV